MRAVQADIDRILSLLRNRIHQQGYTQLEVQEVNGWGRSYISQLLTQQKSLRVDHVLMILNAIDVDPAAFYGEVYQFGDFAPAARRRRQAARRRLRPPSPRATQGDEVAQDLKQLGTLMDALLSVLIGKNHFSRDEFDEAIQRFLPST